MESQIEAHELGELWIAEAKHVAEVLRVIEGRVTVGDLGTISVLVSVDESCNSGNFGANIKSVLEGGLPILRFVDTAGVCLSKLAIWLAHEDTSRELGHGVHVLGQRRDELLLLS